MKVLTFKDGKPEWSIPLNELSMDMKRMLRMQWSEFINELHDLDGSGVKGQNPKANIAMLERLWLAA